MRTVRDFVRTDLHNHLSTYSSRIPSFDKTVDVASEKLQAGGVLGVVNFADRRYEDFVSQAGYDRYDKGNAVYVPQKDLLIVKGQEVQTDKGHILVLGLPKDKHLKFGFMHRLKDALKEAKDEGGVIIADHPFYCHGIGPYLNAHSDLLAYYFDGIETHNGAAVTFLPGTKSFDANKAAQNFFQTHGKLSNLGYLVSSDGHSLFEIGSSYKMMPNFDIENEETIRDSIRKGVNYIPEMSFDRVHKSRLGSFGHIGALAFAVGLSKFGLDANKLFALE